MTIAITISRCPGEGCEGSSPADESYGSRGRGGQERSGEGDDHLDDHDDYYDDHLDDYFDDEDVDDDDLYYDIEDWMYRTLNINMH